MQLRAKKGRFHPQGKSTEEAGNKKVAGGPKGESGGKS